MTDRLWPLLDLIDHSSGNSKSVYFKASGGWAKFNRNGVGWDMDPADWTSRSGKYFDNYEGNGIPAVNRLD